MLIKGRDDRDGGFEEVFGWRPIWSMSTTRREAIKEGQNEILGFS